MLQCGFVLENFSFAMKFTLDVNRDYKRASRNRQARELISLRFLGRNFIGAGEGNRTLVVSLEGFCSTIELHPQNGGWG